MSFQLHKSFVHLRNTRLDKNREACDYPIDCQVNNTVKVQKSMKSITRVVHLPSVVQSEFYKATRILFVRKENKNIFLFQQFVSSLSLLITVVPFWRLCTERKQRTLFCIHLNARMCILRVRFDLNENSRAVADRRFWRLCTERKQRALFCIHLNARMCILRVRFDFNENSRAVADRRF